MDTRTRMTIDNDSGSHRVTLEYRLGNGDTMAFNVQPPMQPGESLGDLERRILKDISERIASMLAT